MNAEAHIHLDPCRSQHLGEMLAKSATVMIWVSNAQKDCVYFNQSWLSFTGRAEEKELGFGWADGVHPEDFDRCLKIFNEAFDARSVFSMDYRLRRADGEYRWIRDGGAPYVDEAGNFLGYIGSCFEIHDQVVSRTTIEKSEREYRETINGLLVGVVVHAPDGSILLSNTEASHILGLSKDQMAGKQATDKEWKFVRLDQQPMDAAEYPVNLVISSGQPLTNYELGIVRPDRDFVTWVNVNAKPLFDSTGDLEQVIVNFADITDRKEAESLLYENQYKLAVHIENTPLGCVSWDKDFRCTEWNPAAERIFGYSASEAVGKLGLEFLVPVEARDHVGGVFESLLDQKGGQFSSNDNVTKDGVPIVCDWFNTPIVDKAGRVTGVSSLVLDVTASREREAQLLTQSQITSNMMEGASLVRASDQLIVYANRAFEQMFGYGPGELDYQHVSILNYPGKISPADMANQIQKKLDRDGFWRGEIENKKRDGSLFWCSATISIFDHPDFGKVYLSVHTDITERKSLDEKLSYQASHDGLTGLISRTEFEGRATGLIERANGDKSEHAMCFLDLDQFKVINDTCGHQAGDELLRQIARLLEGIIREQDTLARLGGDEFALLMENCSLRQAEQAAQDLLAAITEFQFVWENRMFRIGVSVGLVPIDDTTSTFTNLFKQADAACYLAKDLGRNRVYVFRPDDAELGIRQGEMQWVGRINEALLNDQFCLYAQPIVSLHEPEHRHFELLIRMIDREGGTIPPGAFLPAAERYNLIGTIDRWVVETAFRTISRNPVFFETVDFVSINLSGVSLTSEDFLHTILRLHAETGIDPARVCFEITETTAVSNLNIAVSFIQKMKSRGFKFALDDFGSGISSFGYLKNLPVDYLKIDGMFVRHIVQDPIDYAMVRSINDIGHMMGMKTIAEFVETTEIADKLSAIRIDYGQGYALGKPRPLSALIDEYPVKAVTAVMS